MGPLTATDMEWLDLRRKNGEVVAPLLLLPYGDKGLL